VLFLCSALLVRSQMDWKKFADRRDSRRDSWIRSTRTSRRRDVNVVWGEVVVVGGVVDVGGGILFLARSKNGLFFINLTLLLGQAFLV
jgi:hypothetical protein